MEFPPPRPFDDLMVVVFPPLESSPPRAWSRNSSFPVLPFLPLRRLSIELPPAEVFLRNGFAIIFFLCVSQPSLLVPRTLCPGCSASWYFDTSRRGFLFLSESSLLPRRVFFFRLLTSAGYPRAFALVTSSLFSPGVLDGRLFFFLNLLAR